MNHFCLAGLAVSNKHTYMFSAGDDKLVKCWDLEQNKVCLTVSTAASVEVPFLSHTNASFTVFRLFVLITVILVAFIAWLFILLLTFCLLEVVILCVG